MSPVETVPVVAFGISEDFEDVPKIERPRESKPKLEGEALRQYLIENNPYFGVVSALAESGKAKKLTAPANTDEALKALRKVRSQLREAGELVDRTVRFKPSAFPEEPQSEPFVTTFWVTKRVERKPKEKKA